MSSLFIRLYLDEDVNVLVGVILAVRRPPQAITQRLLAVLNQVTADEMENQVLYI